MFSFKNCTSLTNINIPNSVTSIESNAFSSCTSLTSIIIPDGVTNIGGYAFNGCMYMKEYHIKPTTPPTLGTNVFTGIPSDCIIYVPVGTSDTYKAAENWSTYADYIQEEPNE